MHPVEFMRACMLMVLKGQVKILERRARNPSRHPLRAGAGRGWVFSNKQGRIESIKLTPKQILQDRSKCCKSKRRFEKCVR